jgi:hypothetical protein
MDFSLLNLNDGEKDWTRLAFHKCSHCPSIRKSARSVHLHEP